MDWMWRRVGLGSHNPGVADRGIFLAMATFRDPPRNQRIPATQAHRLPVAAESSP